MKEILNKLHKEGVLRDIDIYFAKNIADSFQIPEGELLFALIFYSTSGGDTCFDTAAPSRISFYRDNREEIDRICSESFVMRLLKNGVFAEAPDINAPFIKQGSRVYMKSFYMDEKSVADFIRSKAKEKKTADIKKLSLLLDRYFPENNMQKGAALNAALNSFSIISGGPGTGKTSTVFKLLAVLSELEQKVLQIAVCAPTGKAAARLTESIKENRAKFQNSEAWSSIPEKAHTIHRLLGMTDESRRPTYNKDNKLPHDILIIDESSMVDVRMMAKVISAMKDDSRFILLGDKDQLASVQPGAVLGDICELAPVELFSEERVGVLEKVSGRSFSTVSDELADITIMLDKSYRYDSTKGIGLLARASGKGDFETVMQVLSNDQTGQVQFIKFDDDFDKIISEFILKSFEEYTSAEDPVEAIAKFNRFRILTPHKSMTGGTEHINKLAKHTLFKAGLIDNTKRFYRGMPVMIVENDYSQGLFNGETGLIYGSEQKAYFLHEKNTVRGITPARLPGHVSAFSMSVHKSQGSESDHVIFVLPDSKSPVLTRELFYTAVTRAREKLTVIASESSVKGCLIAETNRSSGLFT